MEERRGAWGESAGATVGHPPTSPKMGEPKTDPQGDPEGNVFQVDTDVHQLPEADGLIANTKKYERGTVVRAPEKREQNIPLACLSRSICSNLEVPVSR